MNDVGAEFPLVRRDWLRAGLAAIEEQLAEHGRGLFTRLFPDTGPVRRELYPKHVAFFASGRHFRERAVISANRVGKSVMGCYELVCHLTGDYPPWWPGVRFTGPVSAWACGDTNTSVREILQESLLGKWPDVGSGIIPRHAVLHYTRKSGVPEAVESVSVRHRSGGVSRLLFKSYESGRKLFQGTAQHVILCDEEPPEPVYNEVLLRTAATGDFPGGTVMLTFTPLSGLTQVVRLFYPDVAAIRDEGTREVSSDLDAAVETWLSVGRVAGAAKRWVIRITWDDVPHLTDAEKEDFLSALKPYQRAARLRGIPQLGSGAVFPFPIEEIEIPAFTMPASYERGWALDAQALWKSSTHHARDRETGIWYQYDEFKRELASTADHAAAIGERGLWIPGVGDASALVKDADRRRYIDLYRDAGLDIELAEKSVEPGIQEVYDLIAKGKWKVFNTCRHSLAEYETYQRDDQGRIIKRNDHLMDCWRMAARAYLRRGSNWMKTVAEGAAAEEDPVEGIAMGPGSWMG